jgi:predicted small secreted protein
MTIVTAMAFLLTSCKYTIGLGDGIKGSGKIITQTRTITEGFKSIAVSQGIEVVVEQSENQSVTVETDDNLQAHIITKAENGVLIIESDHGYNTTETPKVTVKIPVINGLSASSGSRITNSDTIITDNIDVKSDSGSEIHISVEADHIALETSSGSTIEASGKALKLETSSSSESEIDAEKLMANDITSQSASGSSTAVSPIVNLNATASSGSSINYHKIPKGNLSKEESSGGSISEE